MANLQPGGPKCLSLLEPHLRVSGLGNPASSYAVTGNALTIIGSHKPHCHYKVETPSGGFYTSASYKYEKVWLHILHCFDSATKHAWNRNITEHSKALSDRTKGVCQWLNSEYLTFCTRAGNCVKCDRNYVILSKCRSFPKVCLKILDTRRVTWNKFCNEDQQILGATVQNSVVRATWHPGFVCVYVSVMQVRFQMGWLVFIFSLIILAALRPWGQCILQQK